MVFKERTFYGEAPETVLPQSPADLETRVADCLATVEGLDASDVSVVAENGTIVLSGTVMSLEEVSRAEDAARSVDGVNAVDNRIVASSRA
ncbi:BON domain-containing protein [Rhizobium sp. 32-5/1]|uniref:BON domain-containing protein n=1 Tax=Rhizobium sp. 32-5/1 TaxID=3019602 RepID=UPI00240DCDC8|nr:BON domain-containing protein [Rhizobium sp. 32-5/1]WEZ83311.1 BON domain-containing protein [Rhizobium sp. 32-5/1]